MNSADARRIRSDSHVSQCTFILRPSRYCWNSWGYAEPQIATS